jgi:hypothetical protein
MLPEPFSRPHLPLQSRVCYFLMRQSEISSSEDTTGKETLRLSGSVCVCSLHVHFSRRWAENEPKLGLGLHFCNPFLVIDL